MRARVPRRLSLRDRTGLVAVLSPRLHAGPFTRPPAMDPASFSDIDLVMSYISSEIDSSASIVPTHKYTVSRLTLSLFPLFPPSPSSLLQICLLHKTRSRVCVQTCRNILACKHTLLVLRHSGCSHPRVQTCVMQLCNSRSPVAGPCSRGSAKGSVRFVVRPKERDCASHAASCLARERRLSTLRSLSPK